MYLVLDTRNEEKGGFAIYTFTEKTVNVIQFSHKRVTDLLFYTKLVSLKTTSHYQIKHGHDIINQNRESVCKPCVEQTSRRCATKTAAAHTGLSSLLERRRPAQVQSRGHNSAYLRAIFIAQQASQVKAYGFRSDGKYVSLALL